MSDQAAQACKRQECYLCHATHVELVIWREKLQCVDVLGCRLRMSEEIMTGEE